MLITIVFYVHRFLLLWTFWPLNYIWNLKSIFPQAFKDNASSSGGELITNSYRSSTDVDHHLIFMFIPFFHPTILKATAEAILVCGTGHQSDPALAKCPTNKLPHSCSWQLLMKIADDIFDDIVDENCWWHCWWQCWRQMPNVLATNCLIHVRDNCWWKLLMTLLMTVFVTNSKCPTNKLYHSHSWQLLMTVFTTFVDDNTYDNCQIPNFLIHVDDNCYESWWSHFIHFVSFSHEVPSSDSGGSVC